eukprot:gene11066-19927_t
MDEPYRRSLVADQLGTTAFPTIFELKARSKPTERSQRQFKVSTMESNDMWRNPQNRSNPLLEEKICFIF